MNERRILCVDDEPNVLEGLKRQLRKEFDVSTALGGEEALEKVRLEGPFPVVISDFNMPRMDGAELLGRIKALAPDTVAIMLTGRAELDVAVAALHQGHIFRFLNKPVGHDVLAKALDDAFEQYRLINAERILTAQLSQANQKLHEFNSQLENTVAERTETLRVLYDFVSRLNGLDSVAAVAELTAATAAAVAACPLASLWLHQPEQGELSLTACSSAWLSKDTRLPMAGSLAGRVLGATEIVMHESPEGITLTALDRGYLPDFPILAVPLTIGDKKIGTLTLSGTERDHFSQAAIATIRSLAHSATIALLNQQHRQERDETQDAVIMALAKLSEYRDPETGAHLLRLKVYCRLLCEALAESPKFQSPITPHFIDDLVRSSPLHDIGKVGIPDHILKKAGRHTPEEFELMKTHAAIGGDTLRALLEECKYQGFIQTGMEIAYCHHERWDGSGYPRGLRGEDIPLAARILALADVYDALTTRRVYKPAFSHGDATALIKQGSGSHFDPDLVEAFLRREADFASTARELADPVEEPVATPDPIEINR